MRMSEKLNTCGHCLQKFDSLIECLEHVDKIHKTGDNQPTATQGKVTRIMDYKKCSNCNNMISIQKLPDNIKELCNRCVEEWIAQGYES